MTTEEGRQEPAQIEELFAIAGKEDEAITRLRAGLADLLEVQEAKQSIKALTPGEVKAFIQYRRIASGGVDS